MEDKYLDEVKLLVKWHDKKISDDEFLEKFKLEKLGTEEKFLILLKKN